MISRLLALVAVPVLALGVAACGGGSDESAASDACAAAWAAGQNATDPLDSDELRALRLDELRACTADEWMAEHQATYPDDPDDKHLSLVKACAGTDITTGGTKVTDKAAPTLVTACQDVLDSKGKDWRDACLEWEKNKLRDRSANAVCNPRFVNKMTDAEVAQFEDLVKS